MISASLNGLGRFGQHLLHAWLAKPGAVSIDFACDEQLNAEQVVQRLLQHDRLDFSAAQPTVQGQELCLVRADGVAVRIQFHAGRPMLAPWLGVSDMWLECSGRNPTASDCSGFLVGRTQRVLVSATCWDADQTLLMGYNQTSWREDARVLSYGSCTVNAFVPLAAWVHAQYGIESAHVHVVHNVPQHRIAANAHPRRTACTLQDMAPRLLDAIAPERFSVSYVLIPYGGASLIDFHFRLQRPLSTNVVAADLRSACAEGVCRVYMTWKEMTQAFAVLLGARLTPCSMSPDCQYEGIPWSCADTWTTKTLPPGISNC